MITLYTAILGGSDSLKPAPTRGADRCVCITDDLALEQQPQGWEIWRHASVSGSPRRDAYRLRALGTEIFPAADTVVWIDASFVVRDLGGLVAAAGDAPLAGMRHPERASCYEEGRELVALGQAAAADVDAQLDAYRRDGFVPRALSIAGVLIRRSTPAVAAFNQRWEAEIAAHRGDNTQISLDYAAWKAGLEVFHVPGLYTDTPFLWYDAADHQRRRVASR